MTRLCCVVPFCKNSSAKFVDCAEYICGPPWRLAPKHLKARRALVLRRLKARGDVTVVDCKARALTPYASLLLDGAWRQMRHAICEAAAGT